ncbi:MAG: terminase small subunit [Rickettsiales bacterium]|nr:terminase small subunit [Rickettsiales bacterium]
MTPKQARFVEEYLIDLNATQAAIRAGYSEKTAGQIGEQNLKKLEIAQAIEAAKAKRSEKAQIDSEWVLKESVAQYQRLKDGNANAVTALLGLIGKHTDVQAFKEKLEVEGTITIEKKVYDAGSAS